MIMAPIKMVLSMFWGRLTWLLLVQQVSAQVVKINVSTAKSPQLGINGGLTVKTSGSLTSLNGLKYLQSYKVSDYMRDDHALALKPGALGVIGSSSMMVDEYEVTAEYTLLNIDACSKFFKDLDGGNYYNFDQSTQNTTAFFGVHKKKWYVLLPQGYKVNQQILGHGTVYANNTAFQGSAASDKSSIGKQTGQCGIAWASSGWTKQSITVDFEESTTAVIAAGSLQNDPSKNIPVTTPKTPTSMTTPIAVSGAFSPSMMGVGVLFMVLLSISM